MKKNDYDDVEALLKTKGCGLMVEFLRVNKIWQQLANYGMVSILIPTDEVIFDFAARFDADPDQILLNPELFQIFTNHIGSLKHIEFKSINGNRFPKKFNSKTLDFPNKLANKQFISLLKKLNIKEILLVDRILFTAKQFKDLKANLNDEPKVDNRNYIVKLADIKPKIGLIQSINGVKEIRFTSDANLRQFLSEYLYTILVEYPRNYYEASLHLFENDVQIIFLEVINKQISEDDFFQQILESSFYDMSLQTLANAIMKIAHGKIKSIKLA